MPAAGRSRRLGLLPCSKELFPIGIITDAETSKPRPKVAAEYLLDKLKSAGVTKTYVIIRDGKWDIPTYFGDGRRIGMDLAYVVISGSCGPPDSVDRAYSFIKGTHRRVRVPGYFIGARRSISATACAVKRRQVRSGLGSFPRCA